MFERVKLMRFYDNSVLKITKNPRLRGWICLADVNDTSRIPQRIPSINRPPRKINEYRRKRREPLSDFAPVPTSFFIALPRCILFHRYLSVPTTPLSTLWRLVSFANTDASDLRKYWFTAWGFPSRELFKFLAWKVQRQCGVRTIDKKLSTTLQNVYNFIKRKKSWHCVTIQIGLISKYEVSWQSFFFFFLKNIEKFLHFRLREL